MIHTHAAPDVSLLDWAHTHAAPDVSLLDWAHTSDTHTRCPRRVIIRLGIDEINNSAAQDKRTCVPLAAASRDNI